MGRGRRRVVIGVAVALVAGQLSAAGAPAFASRPPVPPPVRHAATPVAAHAKGATALAPSSASRVVDGLGVAASKGAGTVAVMLRLPAAAATTRWTSARRAGANRAALRRLVTDQVSTERSAQQLVVQHLRTSAPSAHVLYRVQNVYDGVAVRVPRKDARRLLTVAGINGAFVLPDLTLDNASTVPLIGAPTGWESYGVTGSGVKIGVIDTGVDYTHADFGGHGDYAGNDRTIIGDSPDFPSAKVAGGYDFAGDNYNAGSTDPAKFTPAPDPDPVDCAGHGSHVSGTAAGYGVNGDGTTYTGPYDTSTPFDSMRIGPGVAPQASVYALRVFGCSGSTNLAVAGIDWAVDPNGDHDFSDHLDVINLSLGSPFSSYYDEPDATALDNAALAGVEPVASAGNSGDSSMIVGAPGDADRALEVASSVDATSVMDGLNVLSPAAIAGIDPGVYSLNFSWTGKPDVDGTVVYLGPGDNPAGCTAWGAGDAAQISGHILLVDWVPAGQATFPCGSTARANNAAAAGAIGVVAVDTGPALTTTISGNASVPMMLLVQAGGDAIKAQLAGGQPVEAVLSGSLIHSGKLVLPGETDKVSTFSSRGPRMDDETLKPDIAGPGDTVFSVASGTGNQGTVLSGTSMASPHLAGVMALLAQKHPGWTVEQRKALVMNTADADLYGGSDHTGAKHGPSRVGAGRVHVPAALSSDVVAYGTDKPGAVSLSFGSLAVTGQQSVTRTVRVENLGAASASYALDYDPRLVVPGVTYDFPDGPNVTVGAGQSVTFRVRLTAVAAQMDAAHDATLAVKQVNFFRQFLSEAGGVVTLTPSAGQALRVPVYAVVRPASTMSVSTPSVLFDAASGSVPLPMTGTPVLTAADDPAPERSLVTPFELQGTGAITPPPPDNLPPIVAGADLRAVGITTDSQAQVAHGQSPSSSTAYFGINVQGPWTSPADVEFDVNIDTTGDGVADYKAWTDPVFNNADRTDAFLVAVTNLATNAGVYVSYQNGLGSQPTALFDSQSVVMPVPLSAIGGATSFSYTVRSWFVGERLPIDQLGPFSYDVGHPGLDFNNGFLGQPTYVDRPGFNIPMTYDASAFMANEDQGILLLHHLNAPAEQAQIIPAGPPTSVTVSPASPTVPKGDSQQFTATAHFAGTQTQDVTASAEWSSDGPAVAFTSPTPGLATASAVGTAAVKAALAGVSGQTTMTVTDAVVRAIDITPAAPSVAKGLTQQLTASATMSDGAMQDVTASAAWSSDGPAVAFTSPTPGLATASAVGKAAVKAALGGVSGQTTMTVTSATPVSVAVTPNPLSLPKGDSRQLTATATFTDATTQDVTQLATWTADPAVTVSDTAGAKGVVRALALGTSQVTATYTGVQGATGVTVTAAVLRSIAVAPSKVSVPKGLTRAFAATGTYSDGSKKVLTASATWTSSKTTVATVTSTGTRGVAHAVAIGTATITARVGGVAGSAVMTVTAPILMSVQVKPTTATVRHGGHLLLVATSVYSDKSRHTVTTLSTWTSSRPAIASVVRSGRTAGKVTALKRGKATITATYKGKKASCVVTVT